jgi:glucosamine-6-phosphate deaminase
MPFKVIVTRDFDHMSEVAASILVDSVKEALGKKGGCVLGLATGNSPTGLYKQLAKAANAGAVDSSRVQSFNLDEYIGLPGENAQQRALHRESYSFFMIQELFSLLQKKFAESSVPWAHPEDYVMQGRDKGKAVVIKPDARSDYLRWIRSEILDEYEKKIAAAGGMDLQVVGVGGRGHVAFHEAGIPFEGNRMLLVKLDDNTVKNAVTDGHFATTEESPQYAISMGAELVYKAKAVLLLASGSRKAEPVAESLLREPDCSVPISYGQLSSREGRRVVYVLDKAAAARTLENIDAIGARGIEVEDISDREA